MQHPRLDARLLAAGGTITTELKPTLYSKFKQLVKQVLRRKK